MWKWLGFDEEETAMASGLAAIGCATVVVLLLLMGSCSMAVRYVFTGGL